MNQGRLTALAEACLFAGCLATFLPSLFKLTATVNEFLQCLGGLTQQGPVSKAQLPVILNGRTEVNAGDLLSAILRGSCSAIPRRPARLKPRVQIARMGGDRTLVIDPVGTAHGQSEFLFPPLDGANAFPKVLCDVFPAGQYRGNFRMACHVILHFLTAFVRSISPLAHTRDMTPIHGASNDI